MSRWDEIRNESIISLFEEWKIWWKYHWQLSWQWQSRTDLVECMVPQVLFPTALTTAEHTVCLPKQPGPLFHTKSPVMQSEWWKATLKDHTTFPHVVLVLPMKALSENNTSFTFVYFNPQVGRQHGTLWWYGAPILESNASKWDYWPHHLKLCIHC